MVPNLKYSCISKATKAIICRCGTVDECKSMAKDVGYQESEFYIEELDIGELEDIEPIITYKYNQSYVE